MISAAGLQSSKTAALQTENSPKYCGIIGGCSTHPALPSRRMQLTGVHSSHAVFRTDPLPKAHSVTAGSETQQRWGPWFSFNVSS